MKATSKADSILPLNSDYLSGDWQEFAFFRRQDVFSLSDTFYQVGIMKRMQISGLIAAIVMLAGFVLEPIFVNDVFAVDKQQTKKHSVSKKSQASASKKASKKTAAKKQPASEKKDKIADAKAGGSEREVWLQRAKSSEALTGKASWYGKDFHNKATASGVKYDMHTFTAAHRTLPLGTIVKVTDQNNGKSVMVCVTDRGPYINGRIIDLSYAAAKKLDLEHRGVGKVALEVISDKHGTPLKKGHAYYIEYSGGAGKKSVGPFSAFSDAAAMHEALCQAHPEAEVVLGKEGK